VRVLHVLPDLRIGGGQQVVLRNIVGMREAAAAEPESLAARFEHLVCAVKPVEAGAGMESKYAAAGIEVVQLRVLGAAGVPGALRRLCRLIRERGVRLVHTNNTGPDRFFGQLAAWRCGVPVVNTLHAEPPASCEANEAFNRSRPLAERIKNRGRDWLTRRTTARFVAVSERVKRSWGPYLRALGVPEDRVHVVVSGLPARGVRGGDDGRGAASTAELRRQMLGGAGGGGSQGSGPVLMYVARLVTGKGHEFLPTTVARVAERWPGVRLALVGDGPLRGEIEAAARAAGVADRVVMLGHREDVAALLEACDLFVFPSLSEGFGLAVLEAMAAGRAVAAFDLPALHEFVVPGPGPDETALLCPAGDGAALAAAVMELLADPERMRAMGERARRIVAERFTLRASVERLARVYEAAMR
jgi:glycosyltransferase involved in cell wall biosynthesis